MKNKLDFSRELDVWWWSNIPEIKKSSDFIFGKISKIFPEGFKPNRMKNHLKVILTNIQVAHAKNPKLYVSVSMDKTSYKKSKKYPKIYLNYKYVSFLINYLREEGYIEFHQGINFAHFRRKSRIRATQKLLRLFRKYRSDGGVTIRRTIPIILRDTDKNDIDFDVNQPEVKQIIQNVNRINKFLALHEVNAMVPSIDYADFMKEFAICCHKNRYTRVFNNSDFRQGGRFYGHWSQMIPSEYRKYITIDGQSTVELDYSCLHLSMLYGIEGMRPPAGDLYKLGGIDCKYRTLVKKAVNIAINAEDEVTALRAILHEKNSGDYKDDQFAPSPKVILSALRNRHLPVQKYLCSGYGVKLQNIDSQIAENVMLDLMGKGICCLCIHDSFIVERAYRTYLQNTMERYFKDIFKFNPIVKDA